jgi:hypothetical protein
MGRSPLKIDQFCTKKEKNKKEKKEKEVKSLDE